VRGWFDRGDRPADRKIRFWSGELRLIRAAVDVSWDSKGNPRRAVIRYNPVRDRRWLGDSLL
jgi:hypothetical protein